MKNLPSVFLSKENFSARSKNFSSDSIPYSINIFRSSHLASKSSRLFLNSSSNLSATFLLMCDDIFFTLLSLCKYERDTLSGISGESNTPCSNIKYSGTTPSTESVTNTWLQYSCILLRLGSMVRFTFGKYSIPVRLNG